MTTAALDTETTGLDLYHGAKPYLVTMAWANGEQEWWTFEVDPQTREPKIDERSLAEIQDAIDRATVLVLQNAKFDYQALKTIMPDLRWDWSKVRDTLLAGHLLNSLHPHDLTTMALEYLGVDISEYEKRLSEAVQQARNLARRQYPDIQIAAAGRPDMPSAKQSVWKFDSWLPAQLAELEGYPQDHPWRLVAAEYANADSATTLALWRVQRRLIWQRRLVRIYRERLKVLPIVCAMERRGITVNRPRLRQLRMRYQRESRRFGNRCKAIATRHGMELELPRAGNNRSLLAVAERLLTEALVDVDRLAEQAPWDRAGTMGETIGSKAILRSSKTGQLQLNKYAISSYLDRLPPESDAYRFLKALAEKRKRDTAINYLKGYERFWLPTDDEGWMVLHPSLNPTGTNTLRWSSQNPNEQNISKQEGFNLRYCFGPGPGREWWSLDAENIELRIPAYKAGEREMIRLFERPGEPPYYGSYHLLVAHILHPELFEECRGPDGEIDGRLFKKKYKATWYQWVKNGNFAVQYGAVESSGTADRAYHVKGAQAKIQKRFKQIHQLNQESIRFADENGYVETFPDKTVDPKRGYPLVCERTRWGGVRPTVPLNYRVQGTACWWMMKAMINCFWYLNMLNRKDPRGYYMVIQVHDELVFDFPRGRGPEPWRENLPKIMKIRRLMERVGDDIGVPTPVGIEYHSDNWSEGIRLGSDGSPLDDA